MSNEDSCPYSQGTRCMLSESETSQCLNPLIYNECYLYGKAKEKGM